jgi:hypothetical protein
MVKRFQAVVILNGHHDDLEWCQQDEAVLDITRTKLFLAMYLTEEGK